MKISSSEKTAIRRHFASYRLRFMADGTVMAQQSPGGAYGILYTPSQTAAHLGELRSRRGAMSNK
jgi:hypothetical protein